jgi:hypothetical protein
MRSRNDNNRNPMSKHRYTVNQTRMPLLQIFCEPEYLPTMSLKLEEEGFMPFYSGSLIQPNLQLWPLSERVPTGKSMSHNSFKPSLSRRVISSDEMR